MKKFTQIVVVVVNLEIVPFRVSRSDDTMATVKTLISSLGIFKSSRTLFVSVYPFFLLVKSSC